MEIVNGKVILGMRDCHCVNHPAGPGKVYNIKYCQNHTKAQGWHNCTKKTCPRNPKRQYGWHEISRTIETCGACKGTGSLKENYCDYLTIPETMEYRVFRLNRGNTFNENYLGLGCLWSSTDYGEAAKMTDEDLIAKVRVETSKPIQAIHIVSNKDDLTICDYLAVVVTRDGYSVKAGWN